MDQLFKKRKKELKDFSIWINKNKKKDKKEIPDDIFTSCPYCHTSIPNFTLYEQNFVCPHCFSHLKISAHQRVQSLIDDKTWKELYSKMKTVNIENFPGYDNKLKKAISLTGLNEAVICGIGKIGGISVAMSVMDSHFIMGSMGKVVGEKICRMVEYADKRHLPLIIVCTSGGARMQEGIDSLMQMAKVSASLKRYSNHGGFYISLLTHPTTGGVSASFAMLGDIIIAEPKALIGFAGKRVIQNTINQQLPDDFQSAEFLLNSGFLDMIVERKNLKKVITDLLKIHGGYKWSQQ